MKSGLPKVLHDLAGWPLLAYPLAAVSALSGLERVAVVVGHQADRVRESFASSAIEWVLQDPPRGTGDAVAKAAKALSGFRGVVGVANGDSPLIGHEHLESLVEAVSAGGSAGSRGAAGAFLTAELAEPGRYGRVVRGASGQVERIVEASEASARELALREINAGAYAFRWPDLSSVLDRLGSDNAKGEFFLTDAVRLLIESGGRVEGVRADDPDVALGVNTQAELAAVNEIWQRRLRERLLAGGVSMPSPSHVYLEQEVEVAEGTIIHPFSVLRRGTKVAAGCQIGPFAHLRGGVEMAPGAELGNFVEAKAATIGAGAKAKHLTYLGDVEIGARANVGAGTIVANYDGRKKHRTKVGARAFIGSGTVLVAPVEVGEEALTGAGTVVLAGHDVGPREVVVGVPSRRIGTREVGEA